MTNKLTDNPLASSLQTVARIISGSGGLGVSRQIFYVQLGSFDTHNNQAIQHRAASHSAGPGAGILRRIDGGGRPGQPGNNIHGL